VRTLVPNEMLLNPAVGLLSAPSPAGPLTISSTTSLVGSLSVSGLITGSGSVPAGGSSGQVLAKSSAADYALGWTTPSPGLTMPLTQPLTFSPDSTHDIGSTATLRPRDLFLARSAVVGGTSRLVGTVTYGADATAPPISRAPQFAPRDLSHEAPGGYSMFSGRDGTNACANLYWDGSNYQRYNVAQPSTMWGLGPNNGFTVYAVAAGANPASTLNTVFNVTNAGVATLYNSLLFGTDNALDIGQNGAARPRDVYVGRNLNVAGVATVQDEGADTPSLVNQGMTALGGRINIGGTGGGDRIGWMLTGINTPSQTIMNGSTQVLWYAEYWSNDLATSDTRGMDFGVIGPPTVKPNALTVLRIRGVGARAQGPNYATGIRIEPINNGTLENWGLDIAAPGTSAPTAYGIRNEGKAWFKGQVDIGPDGTAANRPIIRTVPGYTQSLSIEVKQYAFIGSANGSHLCGNAYWDGSWQRFNVATPASLMVASGDGTIQIQQAAAGANPIGTWAVILAVNPTGIVQFKRVGTMADPTIEIPWQGWLSTRTSSGGLNPMLSTTGDDYVALYCGPTGLLFTNYNNTLRIGTLDNGGNLSVNGQVQGASLNITPGGGSFAGRTNFFGATTTGIATTAASQGSLEVQPSGGGAAMICFHRPGAFATYFGVDTDSIFRVGGWSMGAAAYRLILGDGYPSNPSLGLNGANVGTNGVIFSCHANLYGGVYYSTSGAFVAWPSEGRFKARQAALPDPLALLERPAISYRQPSVAWADGEALVSSAEDGEPSWGFRAEDWRDIPELVQPGPAGIDSFNLTGMIPLTWDAVRAIYAELVTLRHRVEELERA